jgi:hypothetical protein
MFMRRFAAWGLEVEAAEQAMVLTALDLLLVTYE